MLIRYILYLFALVAITLMVGCAHPGKLRVINPGCHTDSDTKVTVCINTMRKGALR